MSANFSNAAYFLVTTLIELYLWVLILRVLLQQVRADFYNPVSQLVWRLTQPLVGVPGRLIPSYRQWDLAGLLVLLVGAILYIHIVCWLLGFRISLPMSLWQAVLKVISMTLLLFTFSIFVQAILSWLGPGVNNRAGNVLWSLNEPLLRPLRRVIPSISGIDVSPLVAILLLQVLYRLLPLHPVLR